MRKHKKQAAQRSSVIIPIIGFIGLGLLVATLLKGKDVMLFSPQGLIAGEQRRLMVFSVLIMLEICIPTLCLLYFFAWKYRDTHATATYDAHAKHGKLFNATIWAIPIFYMIILASVMWPATHRLAPQKSLATSGKPLRIQVVALRWKWLFMYPEQHVASVNFVQIPTDTPVQFELTADETPMSSFWIPHLGGQLYAMTGHQNRLNLMANTAGDYTGSAAEINGEGFAGMRFVARASSLEDFDVWVQQTKQTGHMLDETEYNKLLEPSENNQAAFYAQADMGLYDTILAKYADTHKHGAGEE